MEPIPALAFHRGITHSLVFSLVLPLLLAWLVQRLYLTQTHRRWWYRVFVTTVNSLLLLALLFGLFVLFGKSLWAFLIPGALGCYLLWRLYKYYLLRVPEDVNVSYGAWYLLFFLALSTHFILDCFTSFGTQVFLPFSDYRVAFNTIAVVDPIYTVPFLICVITASTINRKNKARAVINYLGICLSSAYLLFTVYNKARVDRIWENAIEHRNLDVNRMRTSPVIFNNALWNCVAEGDSVFYAGLYSVFDSDPNLHYLNVLPKNAHLAHDIDHLPEYKILQWFSDGYLIHSLTDSALVLSDIRYGGMGDTITSHRDLIFNFFVKKNPDGGYAFSETRERPENVGDAFRKLWKRIMGY
jgi:inner membrane protein